MTKMLFLTYYNVDRFSFDPWIESVNNLTIVQPKENFRFHGFLRWVTDTESPEYTHKELVFFGLRQYDLSPNIESILLGTQAIKIKLKHPRETRNGFEDFPNEYVKMVKRIHRELDLLCTNCLEILCWRYGIKGGPPSLKTDLPFLRWKKGSWEDAVDTNLRGWYQIPNGAQTLEIRPMIDIQIPNTYHGSPSQLLSEHHQCPIGQRLLREAWRHINSDPRSSLVMAVAAAETAFKEFASDLLPETDWLLENVPSPPLIKMTRNWLESIPTRNKINNQVKGPPKKWTKRIQEAVELRNKLVHGAPTKDLSVIDFEQYLFAIKDFIYLLDYYRGHKWAMKLLSKEIQIELGIKN